MPKQQIIWTALPNGLRRDGETMILKLSVFVSPRLDLETGPTLGKLSAFPDFLDWPERMRSGELSFTVVQGEAGAAPITARIVTKPPANSELWKALFGAEMPVRSHKFQVPPEAKAPYAESHLANVIADGYHAIGSKSPYGPADNEAVKGAFRMEAGTRIPGDAPASDTDAADAESPLASFVAFHQRPARADAMSGTAASPDDVMDFHQLLSALGEFPVLLRRAGLVIDLEFTATDALKSQIGQLKQLRVDPRFVSPRPGESYTPLTRYIFDDRKLGNPLPFPFFAAAPRKAAELLPADPTHDPQFEIVGGLWNLRLKKPAEPSKNQFDIVSLDVDSAGQKVVNALRSIGSIGTPGTRPVDSSGRSAAPTLRAGGLSLVRSGQAKNLNAERKRAAEHEAAMRAGQPAELFAEDLVRGYRIDVRRFTSSGEPLPWLSLHQRTSTFAIKRQGLEDLKIEVVEDEGFVQPSLVQQPAQNGAAGPLFAQESICRWQGWSLAAPPPANPMDLSSAGQPTAAPSALPRVTMTLEARPRSLPRLRYGSSYQLRARTVDLAGNSLGVEEATAILKELKDNDRPEPFIPIIKDELPYRRFDPVPAPALVPREELTEGETLDTLVIRSNGPGTTTASYAAGLGGGKYRGVSERHVVPPRTSQNAAETHGLVDGAFGSGGDPLKFFHLCQRRNGTLKDNFVVNLETGTTEVFGDSVDGAGELVRHGLRFVKVEQPGLAAQAPEAGYMIHYEAQLRLPYLPDPLARGAALFGLPGTNGKTFELKDGATPGTAATLAPADRQVLPDDAIKALGHLTKIGFGSRSDWPELRPFRLRLDEAAPGPEVQPQWSEDDHARVLTVRLAPGECRTAWISCYPDAADVDLFGVRHWWDKRIGSAEGARTFMNMAQHGALAMLTPAHKLSLIHAVQKPIIEPTQEGEAPFAVHKFPANTLVYIAGAFKIDGLSTAKLDLFASWSEPDELGGGPREFITHVLEFPIHRDTGPAPPPRNPVPIANYIQETDRVIFFTPEDEAEAKRRHYLARHEFGDTRHRLVMYRLVATTRFREYFPERITSDIRNITREASFERVVNNSAIPPVPELSHIIACFGWKVNPERTRSKRLGGTLRVYLGRTWFASGAGEMLAIFGEPQSGGDPIHVTPDSQTPARLKPSAAPVEVPGVSEKVFPFTVEFDAAAGLWYADVTFDAAGTYFPFVRFALARYQPHSLKGMHLSPAVDAGMHQLAPDREVEITDVVPGNPTQRTITITVTGPRAPAAAVAPSERSVRYSMDAAIEQRPMVSGVDERDALLGWDAAGAGQPVAEAETFVAPLLWKGSVLVARVPSVELRIVIREYEVFDANEAPPGQGWIGEPAGTSRRLVYADVIPLT